VTGSEVQRDSSGAEWESVRTHNNKHKRHRQSNHANNVHIQKDKIIAPAH